MLISALVATRGCRRHARSGDDNTGVAPGRGDVLRFLLLGAGALVVVAIVVAAQHMPLAASSQPALIRLRYAEFDPLLGVAALSPSDLLPMPMSGIHPYIVQFTSAIDEHMQNDVTAVGADIVDYIPDDAYAVLASVDGAARLKQLPSVRWVGYFQPSFRIDPALSRAQGPVAVSISLFSAAGASQVAALVDAGGGHLRDSVSADTTVLNATVEGEWVYTIASSPHVAWVSPQRVPRLWNGVARAIMDVMPIWTSHDLRGMGQVVAVADTGLDTGDPATLSADFGGRIVATYAWGRSDDWSDTDGHGTHVAGSAVGSGANSGSDASTGSYADSHAGVAPEAGLIVQSVMEKDGYLGGLPADVGDLLEQAYDAGARVHSNSWGVSVQDGGRVYDAQARAVDEFVWDHPDMVVVFASGNDGLDANRDGTVDMGSVTTPATAKNAVSVGASESVRFSGGYTPGGACAAWGDCWPAAFPAEPLRGDLLSNDPNGMAAFSSRGPAPDGRVKPDIVAPGTNIISTKSALALDSHFWGSYDSFYAYNGGTSMSAPLVAGASAVVRQYYGSLENHNPSAALVKATLLAGAVDMKPGQFAGNVEVPQAPNNVEGWGRLSLSRSLYPVPPASISFVDEARGLRTGQTAVYTYSVESDAASLRIVVAWSDHPSSLTAQVNLVNDLDVQVTGPLTTANTLPGQQLGDHLNNVEGINVVAPAPGVYRVTVYGRSVPFGPQPYALVVSADLVSAPQPPVVGLALAPGYVVAGSVLTVTWTITGGNVITATALGWDTISHEADRAYAYAVPPLIRGERVYTATLTAPESGAVYLAPSAWIDGNRYDSSAEAAVNVVGQVRRAYLPVILTYPPAVVAPTPTPASAVQLVRNGGFEDGAPLSPPWAQYDWADPAAYLVSSDWPHNGRWSVWFGGFYSDVQRLHQTISVPPGVAHAQLSFRWFMNSEDSEDDARRHSVGSVAQRCR